MVGEAGAVVAAARARADAEEEEARKIDDVRAARARADAEDQARTRQRLLDEDRRRDPARWERWAALSNFERAAYLLKAKLNREALYMSDLVELAKIASLDTATVPPPVTFEPIWR